MKAEKTSRYVNQQTLTRQRSTLQINPKGRANSAVPQQKQCRICLVTQQQSPNKFFIRPCRCSGSCLKQWIKSVLCTKTKQQQKKIKDQGLQCQICKNMIKFQSGQSTVCRKSEQLTKNICNKKVLFIVVVLLCIVSLSGLSFSTYSIITNSTSTTSTTGSNVDKGLSFQIILSICGVSLLTLFFLLGLYTLITEYCLTKNFEIGKIRENSNIQIYSRSINQIIPIQDDNLFQNIPTIQLTS